jgi:hypothetical protein
LEKRGILVNVLPERFERIDLAISNFEGTKTGTVQVKACHPDRADSIDLGRKADNWVNDDDNDFVVIVWMGSTVLRDPPVYWVATKPEVGRLIKSLSSKWHNRERRFALTRWSRHYQLNPKWRGRWEIFEAFQPREPDLITKGHVKRLANLGPP